MGGAKKKNNYKKRAFAGYILPKLKVENFYSPPNTWKSFNPFFSCNGYLKLPAISNTGGFLAAYSRGYEDGGT